MEFGKKLEEYTKSLTDDDKKRIADLKASIKARSERFRKMKLRREFEKPKKPPGPFLVFLQERRSLECGERKQTREEAMTFIEAKTNEWRSMSDAERSLYKTSDETVAQYK